MKPSPSHVRFTKWLAAIALVLLGTMGWAWWMVAQHGEEWKRLGVEALNENVTGTLTIETIGLSWWRSFPDVSVDLTQVSIQSPQGQEWFHAQRLGMEIDVWSLMWDHPTLKTLTMDEGSLFLEEVASGRWNVDGLLAPKERLEDNPSLASLPLMEITGMAVEAQWRDGSSWSGRLVQASIEPGLEGLSWSWEMDVKEVQGSGGDLPPLQPFGLSFSGTARQGASDKWEGEGKLSAAGMSSHWGAFMTGSDYTVELECTNVTFDALDDLLVRGPWSGKWSSEHQLALQVKLTEGGVEVDWNAPENDVHLAPAWTGLSMALNGSLQAKGSASRGQSGPWRWEVTEAKLQGAGWQMEGSVMPEDHSALAFQGKASLDMVTPFDAWVPSMSESIRSALPASGKTHAEGRLRLHPTDGFISFEGSIQLQRWAGVLDGIPYLIDAPSLAWRPSSLDADSLFVQWAGNEGWLQCRGLTPRTWWEGGALKGTVDIDATRLSVDPILTFWDHLDKRPATEALLLTPGSSLALNVSSQFLEWDNLECTELSLRSECTHNRWNIRSARLKGLEGQAQLEGGLKPGRAGWMLGLRGTLDDVSLPELFSTYQDFGQGLLRHEHLQGAVSLAGSLAMSWDLGGGWHGEQFTASLETEIRHGHLQGLEAFDDMANYLAEHRLMAPLVDPDDLRGRLKDIDFRPIDQHIEVSQRRVDLPKTLIESSAMNLSVEGVYTFDHLMDYTIGFALRDLRASASDALGVMEDDGLGSQFFLNMSGPVSEPIYSYDRAAARTHRKNAVEAEKQRLREALRGESPKDPRPKRPRLLDRVRQDQEDAAPDRSDLLNPDDDDYL
tara:strand:+ start:10350 stop:12866 length:2517 start_codon:yes stop_codon:yes gene_type:complete